MIQINKDSLTNLVHQLHAGSDRLMYIESHLTIALRHFAGIDVLIQCINLRRCGFMLRRVLSLISNIRNCCKTDNMMVSGQT